MSIVNKIIKKILILTTVCVLNNLNISNSTQAQQAPVTQTSETKAPAPHAPTASVSQTQVAQTQVAQAPTAPANTPNQMDSDERELLNKIRKGVVAISVTSHASADEPERTEQWSGSGFFIDFNKENNRSLILTNAHVAGSLAACTYEIKLSNGQSIEAKCEYVDPLYDFAILSVKYDDLPTDAIELQFSDETDLLNTPIYSMGNTERNEFSIYKGYIFDDKKISWIYPVAEQAIQFSGLTGPGASGSPVFDKHGKVVGLLYGGEYIAGLALPNSYLIEPLKFIKEGKKYYRYFCGAVLNYLNVKDAVEINFLSKENQKEYNNSFQNSQKVVYVLNIFPAYSNSEEEGLKSGDIIWKVNDELIGPNIKRIDEIIQEQMIKDPSNQYLNMEIYRDGKPENIKVKLIELSNKSSNRMLVFAGTCLYELNESLKMNYNESTSGVYLERAIGASLFKNVLSPKEDRWWWNAGKVRIKSIDNYEIHTLEDVIKIIPELINKKTVCIKFVDVRKNKEDLTVICKYQPEFAKAILYEFDETNKKWIPQDVKDGIIKKQEIIPEKVEPKKNKIEKVIDNIKGAFKKDNEEGTK